MRARREARTHEKHSSPYDHLIESTNRTIAIMDEKKHREALSKAEAMEAVQDAETTTPGRTFIREADKGNASSKISRYGIVRERSLLKGLHEPQRL